MNEMHIVPYERGYSKHREPKARGVLIFRNTGTGHEFVIHFVHNNSRPRLIRLVIMDRQDFIPARGARTSSVKTQLLEF